MKKMSNHNGKKKNTEQVLSTKSIGSHLILLAGIVLLVVGFSCSSTSNLKLASFLFDGVPGKEKKDTVFQKVQGPVTDTIASTGTLANKPPGQTNLFVHPPYRDRACTQCHNPESPGKIPYSQDEYCYKCHSDFQVQFKYVHGPVAGGFCTMCHTPHYSKNKHLLVKTGQDLCLTCHTPEDVWKNKEHSDIGKSDCLECHNPHGSKSRFLFN